MLAGIDRRFEMLRTVAGRRGQHHDIDIGMDQLLEGIEADEMMFRIDLDARLDGRNQILGAHLHRLAVALHRDAGVARDVLGVVPQLVERAFQLVFENVGHGDQVDVFVAGQQIHDRLCAAAAATHDAGL